jgi:hypothetical protein
MKRLTVVLFALFAMAAFAADVAGTWKATFEGPNGSIESTFVFAVDGGKVSGTVTSGTFGESKIVDGKVDADNVTFATVRSGDQGEFRLNYKGKLSGDEIKFEVSFNGGDQVFPITAKRVK